MSEDQKQPFALKYRPTKFKDYIGNKKDKRELQTLLHNDSDHLPNTFMFVGTSGCGKTTAARIIAKYYLCSHRDGYEPCEECSNCKNMNNYIQTGNTELIDNLYEIDVTQERGISQMDTLKASMEAATFTDSWKVYIFDEFHAASYAAQTSLLKVLEDTPDKVLIIICTTEENKILPTIKSRIQHTYRIKKPDSAELLAHLANICNSEGIQWDNEALRSIVRLSNRQIRDAVKMVDEVYSTYGNVKGSSVADRYDLITDVYAQKYFKCYRDRDLLGGVELLGLVKSRYDINEFYKVLREFILQGIYVRNGVSVSELTPNEVKKYKELFKALTPVEILELLKKIDSAKGENLELNLLLMLYERLPEVSEVVKVKTESVDTEGMAEQVTEKKKAAYTNGQSYKDLEKLKRQEIKKKDEVKEIQKSVLSTEDMFKTVSLTDNLHLFKYIYKIQNT